MRALRLVDFCGNNIFSPIHYDSDLQQAVCPQDIRFFLKVFFLRHQKSCENSCEDIFYHSRDGRRIHKFIKKITRHKLYCMLHK